MAGRLAGVSGACLMIFTLAAPEAQAQQVRRKFKDKIHVVQKKPVLQKKRLEIAPRFGRQRLHIGRSIAAQPRQIAIAARPRRVRRLPEGPANAALIEAACEVAFKQVRPLANINGDLVWRREMVRVLLRRAFVEALGE